MSDVSFKSIWIVSEGSPGHVSQSEGLAAALARELPVVTTRVETRPRLRGFGRSWARAWMGKQGHPLPRWFVKNILRCLPPAGGKPDLLVASGGKSVFAAKSLAARSGAPLVFIGERKPYPSAWFHTVLTPSPFETGENDVAVDLVPTKLDAGSARRTADAWPEKPGGRLWAMIVGGRSASHLFDDADWAELARAMNRVAAREGVRWLITTSRRTGAGAEAVVRENLDPAAVADAVWWAEQPRKILAAYLGAADAAFVTQDSVTMATEALSTGKPVVLVAPREVRFPRNSFMPGYLRRLEEGGLCVRRFTGGLDGFSRTDLPAPPPVADGTIRTAALLLRRLGWAGRGDQPPRAAAM